MRVWPSRFKTIEQARQYARRPEAIANTVYANRMGNRDVLSGDGWRYAGKGLIQLTGRSTQIAYLHQAGLSTADPDVIASPPDAALSACWFWGTRQPNLNVLADYDDEEAVRAITRRINGGLLGVEDRLARWKIARAAVQEIAA